MLARWFGAPAARDGGSAMLEAVATGISPVVMAAAEAGLMPAAGGMAGGMGRGRRERALGGGQDILVEELSQKVLHGWLQNRHQTLYPLTVNLRSMAAGPATTLAAMMAVAVLADRQPDAAAATARAWFASVGADAAALAAFDQALEQPPALSRVLETVIAEGLSAYAYVVALVSLDPRDAAATHFLDYIAARLALPTTVVRSANRRYRR